MPAAPPDDAPHDDAPHDAPHDAPVEEAVYDSERTGLVRRALVSLGTGLAFWAMTAFASWGLRAPGGGLGAWLPRGVGFAVAVGLLVAAVSSRVVRRVALDHGLSAVRLYRDPGAVEVLPLGAIAALGSEPAVGGWSRDPSERLVVTLRDGTVRRYTLPDDADTPGIATDLDAARRRTTDTIQAL